MVVHESVIGQVTKRFELNRLGEILEGIVGIQKETRTQGDGFKYF